MMKKEDFYFKLPEELIAQDPLEDRSASRLLVLDKESGKIEHRMFRDIKAYLKPGDCLVINDTKVMPSGSIITKGAGFPENGFVFFNMIAATRTATIPTKYMIGAIMPATSQPVT